MIYFLVPAAGAFSIVRFINEERPALADRFRVIHYEDLPSQTSFPVGTYVLSGLDQLMPANRQLVTQLYQRLTSAGVRVLNHPQQSLRRFDLLTRLYELGWNDFRAVRAGDDFTGLRYPVFVRGERSHEGALTPLLDSPRQVEQAIGRAVVQGRPFNDLLVVEFCSTADSVGCYRKYGAFIVGDKILARGVDHGADWMTKFSAASYSKERALAERDYVVTNPHQDQLREIFRIAEITYGRIDYAIRNDRVQTWEINLNATIHRGPKPQPGSNFPPEIRAIRDETKGYFFDCFQEAWEALDAPVSDAPPLKIDFDPSTLKMAASEGAANGKLLAGLRTAVRPIKPVIDPLANPFLRRITALMKTRQRS